MNNPIQLTAKCTECNHEFTSTGYPDALRFQAIGHAMFTGHLIEYQTTELIGGPLFGKKFREMFNEVKVFGDQLAKAYELMGNRIAEEMRHVKPK